MTLTEGKLSVFRLGWLLTPFVALGCSPDAPVSEQSEAIIGGTKTAIEQHPWLVSIRARSYVRGPSEHQCGGSILNEHWIVTAAHCFESVEPYYWVAAGVSTGAEAGVSGQRREIERIIVHEDYRGRASGGRFTHGEYDIALLRLASPLDLSQPGVAPIERVAPGDDQRLTAPGLWASVAGWGSIKRGSRLVEDELYQLSVPFVSNEDAQKAFPLAAISQLQLAAGEVGVEGKGHCIGDSGSALVVRDPHDDKPKIAGLVSWGYKECADGHHPGMYARVSAFQSWIDQHIDSPALPEGGLRFTSLQNEQFVNGLVPVAVTATREDVSLARVEFHAPDRVLSDAEAPFEFEWNSTAVLDGKHAIVAKGFDENGVQLVAASLSLHVVNQQKTDGVVVLEDFEAGFVDWTAYGSPHTIDGEKKVSPFRGTGSAFRGNRSLRIDVQAFGESLIAYQEDFPRLGLRDLSRYHRLRFWAKKEGAGRAEIALGLLDRDHERWLSTQKFALTDRYQEFEVAVDPNAFQVGPDNQVEDGDGRIDWVGANIRFFFLNGNSEEAVPVVFYVDDLIGDLIPRVEPLNVGEVLFDFETEDSNWRAFGHYAPSVNTAYKPGTQGENHTLRYQNNNLDSFGGVVYPLEQSIDLSEKEELFFDASCVHRDDCNVSFGFQDSDGESWVTSSFVLDSKLRQVRVSLDRENFALAEVLPVEGATRNYRPDFDQVKAFSFVMRGTTKGGFSLLTLDNVFTRDADAVLPHASRPWQVSIRSRQSVRGESRHHCAGAILNEYWILTNAGCFQSVSPYYWVAAGVGSNEDAGVFGQRREIARLVVHEDYVGRASGGRFTHGEYDVALVRLASPLDLSQSNVSAIERVSAAYDEEVTKAGLMATVAGWGAFDGPLPELSVPIVSNERARDAYPLALISERQLAAGDLGAESEGHCVGDGGSALLVHDPSDQKMKLAGLLSWGYKDCSDPHHPAMYARTAAYQDWIDERISDEPPAKTGFQFLSPKEEQFVEGLVSIDAADVDGNGLVPLAGSPIRVSGIKSGRA